MTIGHTLIGSGKEGVIVLHGWFGDYTVFNPMVPYLDGESYTYAFMDYRGYGKSRDVQGEHSIKEISGDAIELADLLGWERFHVIGHSMGGSAAQRVAVDAGGRLKTVICVTPVPASGVPFDDEGLALFSGAAENDDNRAAIIDFSTGNRLSSKWISYIVKESRRTTTQKAFADYFVAWSSTNFVEESKGNKTPFLVAVGEHDQALNGEVMKETFMQWYPNARLEIIPNAGHYPMQETPVYLATLWESFLKEHS